jgi:hypothetical protein
MNYQHVYGTAFSNSLYNVHDDYELRYQYTLNYLTAMEKRIKIMEKDVNIKQKVDEELKKICGELTVGQTYDKYNTGKQSKQYSLEEVYEKYKELNDI